jgi:DNA-binding transcriptional regulator YiaG
MTKKAYKELKREFCVKTHKQLADLIGVHIKTVEGWGRGLHEPSRIALLRIEAARAKLAAEQIDRR